jgi:cobalt-precorrin-6B (C15)-methyltransferase
LFIPVYALNVIRWAMKLPGGSTQDEVLAIDLFKLGLSGSDRFIDIGCGTGKVAVAAAAKVKEVVALDRREEAIVFARNEAHRAGRTNIGFVHTEAVAYLKSAGRFDCAFVGGSHDLTQVITLLADRVERTIVVNAVLLETLHEAVAAMKQTGIFREATLVQVARSHPVAGSIMWKPVDPVYVIVGEAGKCS